ncbi:MAG TPA: hypothetical protein VFO55_14765 [Gemmatimonadaceae bacterium]|nr:hypothetical protein [Gemmatimonadaceae bacterium]
MRAPIILFAAAIAATACTKDKSGQPPENFETPAAPAAPMPASWSLADFGHLRYLEGQWRGTMPGGRPFYESYRFLNDSTILRGSHTDSTYSTKSDSALIVFRAGAVIDSGSAVFHATKLDSSVVDFRADVDPRRGFTWTRESADAWTARILSAAPDGTERVTIYPMRRVSRAPARNP